MFTGIVSGQGILTRINQVRQSLRIRVRHLGLGRGVRTGESVAVNGCCLTVVANRQGAFEFDILQETWRRTCLQHTHPPERVNLECALRLGDPVGGHLVTGHIDGVGRITQRKQRKKDVFMEIQPPSGFMRWVVMKGSVAVDGVSLTVADVSRASFGVWLIPHTLKLTTLGWKGEGNRVNLEGDMLAKYAQNVSRRK